MLAICIIAGILALIIIVLSCPVTAEIAYIDEKFDVKVRFLWLTLFPMKEKPPKKARPAKAEKTRQPPQKAACEKPQNAQEKTAPTQSTAEKLSDEDRALLEGGTNAGKQKKHSKSHDFEGLSEKIALVKMVIASSKKGLRKLLRGIHFDDIAVDFILANEDAYEAALGYGKLNIAVYNGISFLRTFFSISIDHVNISCKYNDSDSVYDGSLKVRLKPRTAISAGLSILFRILVNIVKTKLQQKREEKQAEATN